MLLTEEQELIRDTARAFAQEKVLPNVRAWESAGEIPRALLGEMGKLGFMGMTVPPEWGGAGANMVSYVLALEEIAAVPKRVHGPCLLNVVWGGKTPEIDFREADALGFKLAIVPGLLFQTVIGACDAALAALKAEHRHPVPMGALTVRDAFNRAGALEWEEYRTKFRPDEARKAAE